MWNFTKNNSAQRQFYIGWIVVTLHYCVEKSPVLKTTEKAFKWFPYGITYHPKLGTLPRNSSKFYDILFKTFQAPSDWHSRVFRWDHSFSFLEKTFIYRLQTSPKPRVWEESCEVIPHLYPSPPTFKNWRDFVKSFHILMGSEAVNLPYSSLINVVSLNQYGLGQLVSSKSYNVEGIMFRAEENWKSIR